MISRRPALQLGSALCRVHLTPFLPETRALFSHISQPESPATPSTSPLCAPLQKQRRGVPSSRLIFHFHLSIFRLSSLFPGVCRLFVTSQNINSHRISNLQPLFPNHPGGGIPSHLPNRISNFQPLFPNCAEPPHKLGFRNPSVLREHQHWCAIHMNTRPRDRLRSAQQRSSLRCVPTLWHP